MTVENYSFHNTKTILKAFEVAEKSYAAARGSPQAIYFRFVSHIEQINLLQDTFEYLHETLARNILPHTARCVAFLLEQSDRRFALIAYFKSLDKEKMINLIHRKGWNNTLPSVSAMWQKDSRRVIASLYQQIDLHILLTTNDETDLTQFFANIPKRMQRFISPPHYHRIYEPPQAWQGILFTEFLLQQIFENQINMSTTIIQALQKHKVQLVKKFMRWLEQQTHTYSKKINALLIILTKYHQLQKQRQIIAHTPFIEILLEQDREAQQNCFSESSGHLPTILVHLPIKTLFFLWENCQCPNNLLQQLQVEQIKIMEEIVAWRKSYQQHLFISPTLSWRNWGLKQGKKISSYFWERTSARIYQRIAHSLLPYLAEDIGIVSYSSNKLQNLWNFIAALAAILSSCLPHGMRAVIQAINPISLEVDHGTVGSGIGLIFGIFIQYYQGVFELLFSYMLIFVTELFHTQLNREHIDIKHARFYSIRKYVPDIGTLLCINSVILLVILSMYTNDEYYFKRGLTALGVSEIFRRFFLYWAPKLNVPEKEKNDILFLITLASFNIGTALFNTYYNVQAKIIGCQNAIDMFREEIQKIDPTITHIHSERLDFSLHPVAWFGADNPLKLFWSNNVEAYQMYCQVMNDFHGRSGDVVCQLPKRLPLINY